MGASRKLMLEIDRVLKKVQEGVDLFDSIWNKVYETDNANQKEKFEADLKKEIKKLQRYRDQIKTWIQSSEIRDKKISASYEQELMDSRKMIEREMERFKVCEKETKTKAFSKEGLEQQPKTDPREKAKSETRDWLNNVVSELETQIDSFEAEIEGFTVKKGKTRPPRLIHLETSISRHKAHIMKIELILRLLDNDGLSPENVNDAKDLLVDYVERNQDDFDEFGDVDGLYEDLGLDKLDALEELVAIVPPALIKGVGGVTLKSSLPVSPAETQASLIPTVSLGDSPHHQSEIASTKTPADNITSVSPKINISSSSFSLTPVCDPATDVAPSLEGMSAASASLPFSTVSVSAIDNATPVVSLPSMTLSSTSKEEVIRNIPSGKPPSVSDVGLAKGIGGGVLPSQPMHNLPFGSGVTVSSNGAIGAISSDATKKAVEVNVVNASRELVQPLVSLSSSRTMLPHSPKVADEATLTYTSGPGETSALPGRSFSLSGVAGMQWRPGNTFPNQIEGQVRARTEITPDQREKYLQNLQQIKQHGHSNIYGMPSLIGGNAKQLSTQQNPLLHQFNHSASIHTQAGPGQGGLSTATGALQQSNHPFHQSTTQSAVFSTTQEFDIHPSTINDLALQSTESSTDPDSSDTKSLLKDDDRISAYAVDSSIGATESIQTLRDANIAHGQLLQSNQPSSNHGVIGRRNISDLGTVNANITRLTSGVMRDHAYDLQMLEAAYHKLPQPKDSERSKSYIPKHPVATPASYPQSQAPIVNNPAFWERLGSGIDNAGTDALFFAFYYQQNTYQQYLAAKELKKQSWRYHRKYNTWFQRHEEPKVATDEFEQGTYIYFDFHIANDSQQHGWCQRIKNDFKFEYNYLEDELV